MVKITIGLGIDVEISNISWGDCSCFSLDNRRRNLWYPPLVLDGEPLLKYAADPSCRYRIQDGLVMAVQFVHFDPGTDKRPPRRWSAVEDAIQIARNLRGVEIQQIKVHPSRYIPARQLEIVKYNRGQMPDELRIALQDFVSQFHDSLNLWD